MLPPCTLLPPQNCNPPDNTALLESLRTPDHGFNPIIASQPYNVYLPGAAA